MTDYKIALGIVAAILGFVGYAPYFRDISLGRTRPHVFSWFVWGLLTGIAFFAQIAKGGGAGAWVTGFSAVICMCIAGLALFYGEKDITKSDWLSLGGALLGIVFWQATRNPLLAVIFVTVADSIAFIPTFRKAYHKPGEETVNTFVWGSLKFVVGLAALESFNLTTALYPTSLVLANGSFVTMLIMRRRKTGLQRGELRVA